MPRPQYALSVSEDDPEVAYLSLPSPIQEPRRASRQVRLSDLLSYTGPDLYLDLDADGRLIGIELLG